MLNVFFFRLFCKYAATLMSFLQQQPLIQYNVLKALTYTTDKKENKMENIFLSKN